MFSETLNEKLILTELNVNTKEAVFEKIGNLLIEQGYCKKTYVQALSQREKDYPTGLDINGIGIAIPHTDVSHVIRPAHAIAILNKPVKFEVMGGDEGEFVNVSIVVAMAIDDPQKHLEQVKTLLKILQDKNVLCQMQQAKSADTVIDIIKRKEELL